jgi:hypothetical protein
MAHALRTLVCLASLGLAACGGADGDAEASSGTGGAGAGGGGDPSCACEADEVETDGGTGVCDDLRDGECRRIACEGYTIACIVVVPCSESACGPSLVGLGCASPGSRCDQYGCHFEDAGSLTCSADLRWERL